MQDELRDSIPDIPKSNDYRMETQILINLGMEYKDKLADLMKTCGFTTFDDMIKELIDRSIPIMNNKVEQSKRRFFIKSGDGWNFNGNFVNPRCTIEVDNLDEVYSGIMDAFSEKSFLEIMVLDNKTGRFYVANSCADWTQLKNNLQGE